MMTMMILPVPPGQGWKGFHIVRPGADHGPSNLWSVGSVVNREERPPLSSVEVLPVELPTWRRSRSRRMTTMMIC
jgi:hypothetical protein